MLKIFDNEKKIIQTQDFNQKISVFIYVLFELYRVIISTLLIVFVPQNCNGNLCLISQNLSSTNIFYSIGLIINFFTLFIYLIFYFIEILRELKIIKYLDVNPSLANDNDIVEKNIMPLSKQSNKLNKIYLIDNIYQKLGIGCLGLFIINSIISGIIISKYVLGNQTWSSFFTNISFMLTKLYHIYILAKSEKNIFYSAYLLQKVQFNDIDEKIKNELLLNNETNNETNNNI